MGRLPGRVEQRRNDAPAEPKSACFCDAYGICWHCLADKGDEKAIADWRARKETIDRRSLDAMPDEMADEAFRRLALSRFDAKPCAATKQSGGLDYVCGAEPGHAGCAKGVHSWRLVDPGHSKAIPVDSIPAECCLDDLGKEMRQRCPLHGDGLDRLRRPEAPLPKATCGWCRGNPIGDCAICQAKPSTPETYADDPVMATIGTPDPEAPPPAPLGDADPDLLHRLGQELSGVASVLTMMAAARRERASR
jgi:hypothetical protein